MTHTFYKAFEGAPYSCYWLGNDGSFWMNGEAESSGKPLGNADTAKRVLTTAAAEARRRSNDGAFSLPLMTDALRLQGVTVMPLEEGYFLAAGSTVEAPVSTFSTQIREPLSNIFAVLPLLAKKLDETDHVYPDEIQRNCYYLLRLATNLESAGLLMKRGTDTRTLDFRALVESICFCAASVCKEQGIPIETELPEGPVLVRGDARLLGEAVLNLLRNSLQYTRDGNRIRVRLYEASGRAVLRVEDKGMGVKPEFLEEIFAPYFSADPYGDGAPRPGLGLGLPVAREVVQTFGGTVAAESRFGEGTSITMALPLAPPEGDGQVLGSDPADYLLNRYSAVYVQLCGLCRLPAL